MAEASLEGLARILSSEPLPQLPMFRTSDPVRIAAEMENYARNIHAYLIRLFGNFTATNIVQTIINETGGGFERTVTKLYKYTGDNNLSVTLDSAVDWRERAFIIHGRIADTVDNLQHAVDDPDDEVLVTGGSNASYPHQPLVVTDGVFGTTLSFIVEVSSTGELSINITNGAAAHKVGYIYISVSSFSRVPTSPVVNIGNGA